MRLAAALAAFLLLYVLAFAVWWPVLYFGLPRYMATHHQGQWWSLEHERGIAPIVIFGPPLLPALAGGAAVSEWIGRRRRKGRPTT